MAGSYQNPVQLDHYQDIVEVGWPGGLKWLIVQRYVEFDTRTLHPLVTNATGFSFPADGQPQPGFGVAVHQTLNTWGMSDAGSLWVRGWMADGTEVPALDDYPTVGDLPASGETYAAGDYIGRRGGLEGFYDTGSAVTVPSFITDYLDTEYSGSTKTGVVDGVSAKGKLYFLPVFGGPEFWRNIIIIDGVYYQTWWSDDPGASLDFLPLCDLKEVSLARPTTNITVSTTVYPDGGDPLVVSAEFQPIGACYIDDVTGNDVGSSIIVEIIYQRATTPTP